MSIKSLKGLARHLPLKGLFLLYNKKAVCILQTALLFGACDGTRTCDLLITNELHYQLCYTSISKRYNTLYRILKAMSRENPIIYEKADSMAAVRFGVPFIQCNTKNQLKTIQKIEHNLAYMDYAMIFCL